MTPSSANPESRTVRLVLGEESAQPLLVSATFRRQNNGWAVELSRAAGTPSGSRRLHVAVVRLCELDSAVELAIRSGRVVTRFVDPHPAPVESAHTATEQILPLLLPLRVTDDLYPYQRQGVAWLLRRKRALLGDDMGLGKTAQAIAAARRLTRSGVVAWSLVVAPRTLISNWISEITRWAPELTVAKALPLGSIREAQWARLVRRAHFVLTSYEQLRAPPSALIANPPDLVIADEAHRLRNVGSLSTQGFRKLRASRMWALTGTPLERDAEDLAVLLSLLNSARFSPEDKSLPTTSLRARLRPYLLRRSKANVVRELPPVIDRTEILELSKEQKHAYNAAIGDYLRDTPRSSFLPLFNRLRMLCDVDPDSGVSSKLDRVVELVEEIEKVGEKTVVFSYILEPLYCLEERFRHPKLSIGSSLITGDISLEQRAQLLDNFKSNDACTVLLASTRIASEGLTLTEANHVIFVNQWWNPSSNFQARDRVVRIGQTKAVNVWSFTCRGTVEEQLERLLGDKSLTFSELVDALTKSFSGDVNIPKLIGD